MIIRLKHFSPCSFRLILFSFLANFLLAEGCFVLLSVVNDRHTNTIYMEYSVAVTRNSYPNAVFILIEEKCQFVVR